MSTPKFDLIAAVTALATPYAEQLGLTLWDAEYKKDGADWVLCFYIDSEKGITIDDCENLSRLLDKPLDDADYIKNAYCLQVSSLGLDRHLKLQKDFDRFMGREVEIKLYKTQNGKKDFSGVLSGYDGQNVTIAPSKGEPLIFAKTDCAYIRLKVIF